MKKGKPPVEISGEVRERYVRESGGFCPECLGPDVRRLPASNEHFHDPDGKPKVRVFGSCLACHADWWETYSLSGLEAI